MHIRIVSFYNYAGAYAFSGNFKLQRSKCTQYVYIIKISSAEYLLWYLADERNFCRTSISLVSFIKI